jgi:hypothetical protein
VFYPIHMILCKEKFCIPSEGFAVCTEYSNPTGANSP